MPGIDRPDSIWCKTQHVLCETAIQRYHRYLCVRLNQGNSKGKYSLYFAAYVFVGWLFQTRERYPGFFSRIRRLRFEVIPTSPNPQQSLVLKNLPSHLIQQSHIHTTYQHTKTSGAQPLSLILPVPEGRRSCRTTNLFWAAGEQPPGDQYLIASHGQTCSSHLIERNKLG